MSPQKATSPRACSMGLPISFKMIAASSSRRSRWSSPRCLIFSARSATESELSASRASQALAMAASRSPSEISGYSSSFSPEAGLTTAYMLNLIDLLVSSSTDHGPRTSGAESTPGDFARMLNHASSSLQSGSGVWQPFRMTADQHAFYRDVLGAEVVARGVGFAYGARGAGFSVYFRDPDGTLLELISEP